MNLGKNFHELWQTVCPEKSFVQNYIDLAARYGESHRHYHTLSHIAHALKEFDEVKHLSEHPFEVALAIYYHDAVYETKITKQHQIINADKKRDTNEEQSAFLAKSAVVNAGLGNDAAERVYNLILATAHKSVSKNSENISQTIDEKILVDVDLSILGRPEKEFKKYEENIRKEYSFVPEEIYKSVRVNVLNRFLNREKIYSTDYFHDKYEKSARKNLENSIQLLRGIYNEK